MRHLDLFSGIGGFALAAEMAYGKGVEHIFCEIEPFPQAVLRKHWPKAHIYDDITKLDGATLGPIDLLTGGFPCQPFSLAGERRGKDDDRDLWPEMFRVIKGCRPTWILGENVAGFIGMELERSISDLESEGYAVQTFDIPAMAVDAPHLRHRTWILAYAESARERPVSELLPKGRQSGKGAHAHGSGQDMADGDERQRNIPKQKIQAGRYAAFNGGKDVAYSDSLDAQGSHAKASKIWKKQGARSSGLRSRSRGGHLARWAIEPELGRVANGISSRVDRIKGLGNAIVPQVAAQIMRALPI